MAERSLIHFLLRHLANLCAPGLIFLTTLFSLLRFHEYPIWRPEVALSALAIIAIGLPFGLLISLRPKTFGAVAVTVVLILWVSQFKPTIPIGFAAWRWANQWRGDWVGDFAAIALICAAVIVAFSIVFAAGVLLGRHLGIFVASVFGTVVAGTLVLPSNSMPLGETYRRDIGPPADLPPMIHLVLDEQIGIEGLPRDIAGGEDLRQDLRQFYDELGFTVFGRAYSTYWWTEDSMMATLNGRESLNLNVPRDSDAPSKPVWDNLWFDTLFDRGYQIRVYSYLPTYCGKEKGRAYSCYVYKGNSISNIINADLPLITSVKVILSNYRDILTSYHLWQRFGGSNSLLEALLPSWLRFRIYLNAAGGLHLLDRLLDDVRQFPRGTAFFAHLLIPHESYLYDRNCHMKPDVESWAGHMMTADTPEAHHAVLYARYFEQVRCLHLALGQFFAGLQETGVFDEAIIIVHGDHGARITLPPGRRNSGNDISETDFIDRYSALFAVRSPSLRPGYDTSFRSVQALFAELILERPLPDESQSVFVDAPIGPNAATEYKGYLRVPMPEFGHAMPQ